MVLVRQDLIVSGERRREKGRKPVSSNLSCRKEEAMKGHLKFADKREPTSRYAKQKGGWFTAIKASNFLPSFSGCSSLFVKTREKR